jgi:hypothetical protein
VLIADGDWVNDGVADTIDGGAGFDTLRLVEMGLELDLTDVARFADSLIERIGRVERVDLGSGDAGRSLIIDPASIVALLDMPAGVSGLVIDGDENDSVSSRSSIGELAPSGTAVLIDRDGDGTVTGAGDEVGWVGEYGTTTVDFLTGAGNQTYHVYTHHSYGLLLIDSDIDRSGLILGSI